jgi:hypothetical protein
MANMQSSSLSLAAVICYWIGNTTKAKAKEGRQDSTALLMVIGNVSTWVAGVLALVTLLNAHYNPREVRRRVVRSDSVAVAGEGYETARSKED